MTEFTTWRSLVDGAEIGSIPDSVVSRPADNDIGGTTIKVGVVLDFNTEWPAEAIDARISGNMSGYADAEIIELDSIGSDSGAVLESVDASMLSPGDSVTWDLSQPLATDKEYAFVLVPPDGEEMDQGRYLADSSELPISSDDGNLEIVDGVQIDFRRENDLNAFDKIGNIA